MVMVVGKGQLTVGELEQARPDPLRAQPLADPASAAPLVPGLLALML